MACLMRMPVIQVASAASKPPATRAAWHSDLISQASGFLFALMFQTITLMDGMFNADAGHPGRVRGLETTRNESCMAFRSDIAGERFPVRVDVPDHNAHGWHV